NFAAAARSRHTILAPRRISFPFPVEYRTNEHACPRHPTPIERAPVEKKSFGSYGSPRVDTGSTAKTGWKRPSVGFSRSPTATIVGSNRVRFYGPLARKLQSRPETASGRSR